MRCPQRRSTEQSKVTEYPSCLQVIRQTNAFLTGKDDLMENQASTELRKLKHFSGSGRRSKCPWCLTPAGDYFTASTPDCYSLNTFPTKCEFTQELSTPHCLMLEGRKRNLWAVASEEGTESRSLMCNVLHYFFLNLVLSIFPLKIVSLKCLIKENKFSKWQPISNQT